MVASLRALLSGIIDYAGLFPPAGLPMDQAIRNYARYRQEPESWMLARFICPAAQLTDLSPFVEALFDERTPLHFAALGQGVNEPERLRFTLDDDFAAIARFRVQHSKRVIWDVFEVRVPVGTRGLSMLATSARNTCDITCYYEPIFGPDRRAQLLDLLSHLKRASSEKPNTPCAGLKLRCGGLHASAFPSCEQVAFVIAACRDAKVPLKFTAGLHHPIRRYNDGVQTHMHGFINVFTAGVLAHARGLSAEQLQPILEDEDAAHFAFNDAGLRWKDWHATTDEIAVARKMVTSFGSCSFDEPRDDLRALGWLL